MPNQEKCKKIFKRLNKCMFCKQYVSMNLKIGKQPICYECIKKISKIFNLGISVTYALLRIFDPGLLDEVKKIIELGSSEIDIKKFIKDNYNPNIENRG